VSLATLPTLLLVPPLNLLAAAVAGALMGRRRGGRTLLVVGLSGLVFFSLPVVSQSLIALLEAGLEGKLASGAPPPQAVVILSGDQQEGRTFNNRFWRVGPLTLEREQAGAALARATGAPVLVSGGALHPWSPPLADLMATSLAQDFAIKVRWREAASQDTWANAQNSAAILRADGIGRVWVVTQAWHMRRALMAFRRAGLDAVPAPVLIDAVPDFRAATFLPSARAWLESYYAMHELIGWAWYAVRP
jgi:uncharacterized SAM-binding protein YcdF (DUF218 family)